MVIDYSVYDALGAGFGMVVFVTEVSPPQAAGLEPER
jgi:hypothetical protein